MEIAIMAIVCLLILNNILLGLIIDELRNKRSPKGEQDERN